jgi:hypothetical protein
MKQTSSHDFSPVINNIPPTPAPTVNALSPVLETSSPHSSDRHHATLGQALPTRLARKASKISLTLVSDVKAGSASLFGGMSRKSQQSQMWDADAERMEKLGEMGNLNSKSAQGGHGLNTNRGLSAEECGWGRDEKGSTLPCPPQGIMKSHTISSPGGQDKRSTSMNTKMVDRKPSVRFTLDLPPKLDLDLNFSGSSLDNDLKKRFEGESRPRKTSGGWAERTTEAVLDKSRKVEVDDICEAQRARGEVKIEEHNHDEEKVAQKSGDQDIAVSSASTAVNSQQGPGVCQLENAS